MASPIPYNISPEMLTELALALEPPYTVAQRYGMTPSEYDLVEASPAFRAHVENRRTELENDGYDLKSRVKLMAEQLLIESFKDAVATGNIAHRLEVTKYFTKLAELEPKPGAVASSNNGMMIQINIPNAPEPITISSSSQAPDVGSIPKSVTESFSMSLDLIGEPVPQTPTD